ncbi:MAG: hypothetical protein IKM31_06380 [Oscillospiraceae bacterium]|nr:hypothetical protein [Oscillospiraceae bacterium]
MRKWLYGAVSLLCAAALALIFMGTALLQPKNDMPAVIEMQVGEVSDFAAVMLQMELSDSNYERQHWWDQTVTFDGEVQTRTVFRSQTSSVGWYPDLRSSTTLQGDDWLWQQYTGGDGSKSGTFYIKDETDHYSYTVSIWEEWEDGGMLVTDVEFPWLRSAVGSDDKVVIEDWGNGSSISEHTSVLTTDMDFVRVNGEYYFSLPNRFHGRHAASEEGLELEEIAYEGSSGIFRILRDEEGGMIYDWDENGEGSGYVKAEQLVEVPISSEDDTIVVRMDHLEKLQLLSLLTVEDGELILRLFDIGTGSCGDPIPLGNAFVSEKDAEDGMPNELKFRAQGDKILILQGGFGDMPSRALALEVEALDEVKILLDVNFDIENRNYRRDDWMLYEDGVLYFLEGSEWWGSELRLTAVDKDGVKAFGILKSAVGAAEYTGASYNFEYETDLPGFFLAGYPEFLGWNDVTLSKAPKTEKTIGITAVK